MTISKLGSKIFSSNVFIYYAVAIFISGLVEIWVPYAGFAFTLFISWSARATYRFYQKPYKQAVKAMGPNIGGDMFLGPLLVLGIAVLAGLSAQEIFNLTDQQLDPYFYGGIFIWWIGTFFIWSSIPDRLIAPKSVRDELKKRGRRNVFKR
ncbi:MAG TPA: hypothetical protein VM124_00200 [Candidatus Limnocylindrales bacterium]|nr:hypothetical protein [Candidatus Limnocylindrales bacterium]